MKPYTKLYMNFFGYDKADYIPSEVSGNPAVDIQHIIPRGMGGSKQKDFIENLVALTREEHIKAEHDKEYNRNVQIIHLRFIQIYRPDYKIRDDYLEMLK